MKWSPPRFHHQKQSAMTWAYENRRSYHSHRHELRGDTRLYYWVRQFKPFLRGDYEQDQEASTGPAQAHAGPVLPKVQAVDHGGPANDGRRPVEENE